MSNSFIDHRSDNIDDPTLIRPAIDEIAEEDHLPFRVPVNTGFLVIAEFFEQLNEWLAVAVDVTNQVITHGTMLLGQPYC